MIDLQNIRVRFTAKDQVVEAVRGVSLAIRRGEVFGIVGTSGAGKSTLLRVINLLERPSSGRVVLDGTDITDQKGLGLRRTRQKTGMVFQHFNLMHTKTVFDNVAFSLRVAGKSRVETQKRVPELLELVGLTDKIKSYPSQLSGGQKQRVGIARALANHPEVLLCDEPTSALDLDTSASILGLLRDINKRLGITVVIISHEMAVIKAVCDRVAVMDRGEVVEQGTVFDIFARPRHSFTRGLVAKSLTVDLPSRIVEGYQGVLVKLTFLGETAEEAVISRAIKIFGVDLNVLHGKIEYIGGSAVGVLVVGFDAPDKKDKVLDFLLQNTARLEVLHG